MHELKNAHILVEGRVQGVGFRYFVKNLASELRITGWVRNRFDDRVEILAQGTPSDLTRFIAAVRVGPPSAQVTSLETDSPPIENRFERFSIAPSI
ncbi:MAG TPA: acylphosphatase [Anaerolineaceae bacterium]|nr:acylphosphatase [Anaerolineaceae bacterium]